MKTDSNRAVASTSLVLRWTPEQIEEAHKIVNDIAEDIDCRESRVVLRRSLAIYADLLHDAHHAKRDEGMERIIALAEIIAARDEPRMQSVTIGGAQNVPDQATASTL